MDKKDWVRKLTSRKLWITVAAFIASIATSIAALNTDNEVVAGIGIVCGMLAAAIYAASEAYVDAASVSSETKSTTVTASTTSAKTVAALTGATEEAE